MTEHIDFGLVALYAFWLFFAGLILYLRFEDRREGYPLRSETSGGRVREESMMVGLPNPKVFRMFDGRIETAPRKGDPERDPVNAKAVERWGGSPLTPIGDPMLAGVGPGAYVNRANVAELNEDMRPRLAPMRIATTFSVDKEDPDPRGMNVVGADGVVGGVVKDIWIDRSEYLIRYLEVEVTSPHNPRTGKPITPANVTASNDDVGVRRVLLPMPFAKVNGKRRIVKVESIMGRHFAQVPTLADPDQVTLREEDRIAAYYGAGTLYADKSRSEPFL